MREFARKPYMGDDYRALMKNVPQKAVFDILQEYGRFEKQSEFKQPYHFNDYQVMEDSHNIPDPFVPPDQGGVPIPDDDVVEHQPEENIEDLPAEEAGVIETQTWGDNTVDEYNSKTVDCLMYKPEADTNENGEGYLGMGCGGAAANVNRSVIKFNIKTDLEDLGITKPTDIVSATLHGWLIWNVVGAHNVSAYRVLQNWVEGEVTWNSFSTGNAWNTAGCGATSDTAGDDGSYDRRTTALDTIALANGLASGQYALSLDITDLAREWFEGTAKEYGVLLQSDNEAAGNYVGIDDREGTDLNRPYLEIDFGAGVIAVEEKPGYLQPPIGYIGAVPSYGGVGRHRWL